MTKRIELRRHAPRDPGADRLSSDGQVLAEQVGTTLEGPYQAVFSSPAKRAAETVAWFLRGAKHQLPEAHGVAEGLASEQEDRWRAAAKAAGTGRVDAVWEQDNELVEQEAVALAETVRRLLADTPEQGKALAIGHSPLIEAAVHGLTGDILEPLKECEGVVLVEDGGEVRLEREHRLP